MSRLRSSVFRRQFTKERLVVVVDGAADEVLLLQAGGQAFFPLGSLKEEEWQLRRTGYLEALANESLQDGLSHPLEGERPVGAGLVGRDSRQTGLLIVEVVGRGIGCQLSGS